MSGARVLVVDDDAAILRAVQRGLQGAGFDVRGVESAQALREIFARWKADVIVLDLLLPDGDGADICREIRRESDVPIIVLSAVGDDARKVEALDAGADDYVVKPFSVPELQARVRAAIRRGAGQTSTVLVAGPLRLDLASRRLDVGGQPVHLTPTEFELLRLLMGQPSRVYTQRHLLSSVWGPEFQDDTHILRTFIHQLRTKLSAASQGAGALIVNDPGVGYRIEA